MLDVRLGCFYTTDEQGQIPLDNILRMEVFELEKLEECW